MAKKDYKLIYKLYESDNTYIKTLNEDEILSNFQVSKNLNGGVGNLKVVLNQPIDDYDEYDAVKNPDGSIKYGNRLKVFLNDDDNIDKQIFYGYLVTIGPNYKNGRESVELVFYGAVSKLTNDYFRDYTTPSGDPIDFYVEYVSGATPPEKNPANPSEIIEDIIDNYIGGVSYPMLTKSIDDCGGTDLEYTFDRVKHYDGLLKMQEFLPVTWYWYVNGEGVVLVKDSASSTQHKLVIGKDITAIKSHKTSEDIINYFVLWNARSTVDLSYVYVTNDDATSKANYGTHTLFQADSAILSDAIADIRKNKVIEYNKNPTEEITIEVTDEYDIASIEPGDRVSIRNLKTDSQTTFADDLVVVKISYAIGSALIELGALGSNLTKFTNEESNAFEVALRQVYGIQSGGIAITEAHIDFGGESFIKKNIIYSPIIAGTTGYFKESIRMGDSGIGSVIRTYGKTAFNNAEAGVWIEKNASEDIFFELYKDSDNYLRFNTDTGKLEIAGDITLSPGSTISWSQISDASVPNSADLSNFNNDDSWTDDTAADLAQTAADNAQGDATDALTELANIASDSKITPVEKLTLKPTWDDIVVEATATTGTIPAQAISFGVSHAAFDSAYATLYAYVVTSLNVFGTMTATTNITRSTWDTDFEAYYNQRTLILNAIATANSANLDSLAAGTLAGGTFISNKSISSPVITAGTITGTVIQTSSSAGTGIKMSSTIGGMDIYGEIITIYDTAATPIKYGTIGSGGAYFNISTVADVGTSDYRNILLYTGGDVSGHEGTVFVCAAAIAPKTNSEGSSGLSSNQWSNVYTYNVTFTSGKYLNYTGGYIQSNSQFRVVGSITLTGNLAFENYASITIKDSGGTSRALTVQWNTTLSKYILSS